MSREGLLGQAVRKCRRDGVLSTAIAAGRLVRRRTRDLYREHLRPHIIRWRVGDEVAVRGVTIVLEDVVVGETMYEYLYSGEYEAEEAEAIEAYLDPQMDVVDLGACLGFTACFTAERMADDRTHIAVEPNPQVQRALAATRERNGCAFEILQRAYGTGDGAVELHPAGSAWSASQYRPETPGVQIETVDVEALIKEYALADVALIVDIEGAEAQLIEDELAVLEAHCDLLIVEFHDGKDDIEPDQRARIADARERLDASSFEAVEQIGDIAVYIHPERYDRHGH